MVSDYFVVSSLVSVAPFVAVVEVISENLLDQVYQRLTEEAAKNKGVVN
jgi:hypothetical protein